MTDWIVVLLAVREEERREETAQALLEESGKSFAPSGTGTTEEDTEEETGRQRARETAALWYLERSLWGGQETQARRQEGAGLSQAKRRDWFGMRDTESEQGGLPETAVDGLYRMLQAGDRAAEARGQGGRTLVVTEYSAGEGMDPAGLDRVFQRDARRYDNGFQLY